MTQHQGDKDGRASSDGPFKDRYIELLLSSGALRFGEFKTKSGRLSPYFFNTGALDTGASLATVADLYADLIASRFGPRIDNLFGPAYKGIPLAVMIAYKLGERLGRDVSFTFNRKEAKDHGEGGTLIGRAYRGGERVVVVEDVITGGTSFGETLPLLTRLGVDLVGVVVGVDRRERGKGTMAAMAEVCEQWNVPGAALVTIHDVVARLHGRELHGKVWIDDACKKRIDAYLAQYGA